MFSPFGQRRHLIQRVLSEYLDDRLPAAARQRTDRHLAACAACRQELEGIRGVVSLLRRAPQVPVRRSFALGAPPPAAMRAPLPLRLPTWSYAGAASLAGLVLAVLVSADAVGIPGKVWRDTRPETRIAAPAPLELAAEGTPMPGGDQSVTMKSAEPGGLAPQANQLTQSGNTAETPSTPMPGPAAPAVPPADIGRATETVVGHDAEGEVQRETFGHPRPGPTPWFWRALEGLAAVAALMFLLGLRVRVRRARR